MPAFSSVTIDSDPQHPRVARLRLDRPDKLNAIGIRVNRDHAVVAAPLSSKASSAERRVTLIQRRTFVQGAAAAVLGVPHLAGMAQQSVTLKFHTFMAPLSNVWLLMHKPWMEKVEKESGGRIRFEGYPAMQLGGGPAQLYDQARDGVVDVVWTLPGTTAGRFPRIEVFELPFIMNNAEATSKAYWEYFQTQCPDEFKETQVLALQVHGPGVIHSVSKLVKTPDDLRGMKVRGPTRQVTKLLGSLGATPVGMPLPSIPDALSKGTIDACVIPWEVVPSVKVNELTKFHTEFDNSGPALYTSTFVMAMNKPKYESLAPDLKKVIDSNSGMATSAWLGKTQQANDVLGRKATLERGNTIHQVTPAEREGFVKRSAAIDDDWVADMDKRGFKGRELLASAKALIAKHGKG